MTPQGCAISNTCFLPGPVQAELGAYLKDYVGRESPLYYAERLSKHFAK